MARGSFAGSPLAWKRGEHGVTMRPCGTIGTIGSIGPCSPSVDCPAGPWGVRQGAHHDLFFGLPPPPPTHLCDHLLFGVGPETLVQSDENQSEVAGPKALVRQGGLTGIEEVRSVSGKHAQRWYKSPDWIHIWLADSTASMVFRRRRNFKGYSKSTQTSKRKPTTIQAQLNLLKKTVTKDHKLLTKSIDYTDYVFPESIAIVSYKTWNYISLLQPNLWTSTCRRSNAVSISPETQLKEMTVSVVANHSTATVEIVWYVAIVRAKKDWVPSTATPANLLRDFVDFTDMGPGNAPILNNDKFTILKSWNFSTHPYSQGDPKAYSQRRTVKFKMSQTLRGSAQTVGSADQNWLGNTEADFDTSERLYVLHYGNTPQNISWGVLYNPSITVGVRFSCCTI